MKRTASGTAGLLALALIARTELTAHAENPGEGTGIASVSVFDTGTASATPFAPEVLLKRTGWIQVPEGSLTNKFKGDAVLINNRLAVSVRRDAQQIELYSLSSAGLKQRAIMTPLFLQGPGKVSALRVDENTPDSLRVVATFTVPTNRKVAVSCHIAMGQPYVRTDMDDESAKLRVDVPCRFVVMPAFAKDKEDALVDVLKIDTPRYPLPNVNFFLHLLEEGSAIVALARDLRQPGTESVVEGEREKRLITATEIPYGKGGQVWVAVIEGPNAWKEARAGAAASVPYPAQWRTVPGEPGVTYPRDRDQKTPIQAFTVVDIIRAALGPGPCRYILDLNEVLVNIGLESAKQGPKGHAMTKQEIEDWLAKENNKQKQLRSEMTELAKAGQKIYYNSNFEGEQKIYAVAPDGSGFACITPAAWTNDQQYPHVSPDGKKLIFTGGKLSKEECMKLPSDPDYLISKGARSGLGPIMWMANVDGTDAQPMVIGSCPHWSWDGKYLAYGVQPKPNVRCLGLLDLEQKKEWVFRAGGGNTPTFSRDMKYYIGGAHYIQSIKMEDIMTCTNHTPPNVFNSYGCNQEISPDGRILVHVIDEKDGSWICWYPYNPAKGVGAKGQGVNLGVVRNSMNYFPEFSPDQKYMVWGHWEEWEGRGQAKPNVYNTTAADLYICRWPPDGTHARITWHGGTTQNPSWPGPGKAGALPVAAPPAEKTPKK